jgi:hypothetical protein
LTGFPFSVNGWHSPFNEQQVSDRPIEGRNVVELLSLQPGVTFLGRLAGNDDGDSRSGEFIRFVEGTCSKAKLGTTALGIMDARWFSRVAWIFPQKKLEIAVNGGNFAVDGAGARYYRTTC